LFVDDNMKKFVKEHIDEVRKKKHICDKCKSRFEDKDALIQHKIYQHGIYPKYFEDKKKKEKKDSFDPKQIYEDYLANPPRVSEVVNNCNNPDVPERYRIYSSNKKFWCRKTTKKQAEEFFKSLDELKEKMKTRGTTYVPVELKDKVVAGQLDYIHFDKDGRKLSHYNKMNILYIHDESRHEYRMYTDELRYGDFLEIAFDNKKQCFVVKDINRLKVEWNKEHGIVERKKEDIDEMFEL